MNKTEQNIASQRFIDLLAHDLAAGARMLDQHREYLEGVGTFGETPLHFLAVQNRIDAVQFLIERGADPDPISEHLATPLCECATLGDDWLKMVRILLEAGADPNRLLPDNASHSPMHAVAERGKDEALKLLLQFGGDPNLIGPFGEPPLCSCIQNGSRPKWLNMARILLEAGADPNLTPLRDSGFSPMHTAAQYGGYPMLELLVEFGGDMHLSSDFGTPQQIRDGENWLVGE